MLGDDCNDEVEEVDELCAATAAVVGVSTTGRTLAAAMLLIFELLVVLFVVLEKGLEGAAGAAGAAGVIWPTTLILCSNFSSPPLSLSVMFPPLPFFSASCHFASSLSLISNFLG